MILRSVPCQWPGCPRAVAVHDPIGVVLCPGCAFWLLAGREAALFKRLGTQAQDLYFLSLDEDPLLAHAPVTTLRLEDGTNITSHRLRCVGVVFQAGIPSQFVLIELTPHRALGVV